MSDLATGQKGSLVKFLTRGKPISSRAALFIGGFLEEGLGQYEFRLARIARRGAPTTDSVSRARNAALWVHWTVNKAAVGRRNPKREEAIARAARHFHVDPKRVRSSLKFVEKFPPCRPRELRKAFIDQIESHLRGLLSETLKE